MPINLWSFRCIRELISTDILRIDQLSLISLFTDYYSDDTVDVHDEKSGIFLFLAQILSLLSNRRSVIYIILFCFQTGY